MAIKHRVINIKDIKANFYVRRGINQDHVLMLAELYEAAMVESKDSVAASRAITAIKLTEEGELVDGRHRKEAMELAQLTDIRVEIVPAMSPSQLVVEATKANYGGALPPTREDMIFTVEQLLSKHGMSAKAIEDSMTMLPKSVVRKYINMANRRLTDLKLKLAIADLSNGMAITQAARVHGLKVEAIQLQLEGKKPKSKTGAAQLSSVLTTHHKSHAAQIGRVVNKAIDDYRDGELSEEALQSALNHYGHLLRRQFIRLEDWQNRLKAVKVGEPLPKGSANLDTDNIFSSKGGN